MKAITVEPHKAQTVRLDDIPEPDVRAGSILVEAIAVGVCGTDVEIVGGDYGWAPAGKTRLVLGHESLGRVVDPGPGGALLAGDLVVGIVRRPDPVPCPNCAVGEREGDNAATAMKSVVAGRRTTRAGRPSRSPVRAGVPRHGQGPAPRRDRNAVRIVAPVARPPGPCARTSKTVSYLP